eukprot:CAMPEP_0194178750 /NCGR_PEP_ID=MMETSP0154-20130528/12287_1 /TAXON_ID=1049557 /ORGANISM="Thalassiothrix antarctica, Strain L6-D1" /LENGTH=62 /DNA_ID=CAMNT_0038893811 /DNA_START=404 /DNA_END=589 /DNA_ORIENTATION=-
MRLDKHCYTVVEVVDKECSCVAAVAVVDMRIQKIDDERIAVVASVVVASVAVAFVVVAYVVV